MATAYLLCGNKYGRLFDDIESVCDELIHMIDNGASEYGEDEHDYDTYLCVYEVEYDVNPDEDLLCLYGDDKIEVDWENTGTLHRIRSIPEEDDDEAVETDMTEFYLRLVCER